MGADRSANERRGPAIARPAIARLATGAAAITASAYWTTMSPYSQLLGPFPWRGPTRERVVALTFDDGPNAPFTLQISELLAAAGAAGTFFAVGACVDRQPEVARRVLLDGHVLGSHGYSHRFWRCAGRNVLRQEVRRADDTFARHLGIRPRLFRPPWLLRTPGLFDVAREESLQLVSGDFAHVLEVCQPSASRIARRAVAKARPGSIIIFHDGFDAKGGDRSSTLAAVALVVAELTARGYGFTTVDRLLGVDPYRESERDRGATHLGAVLPLDGRFDEVAARPGETLRG